MRFVTYNILNGGEGRADPLAEVIGAQHADVVALLEADVPAVVERIASRLKMDFIIAPGAEHAAALLSRWPIQSTVNHALLLQNFRQSFLETTVKLSDGEEFPIAVVHLPPRATIADEEKRMKQLEIVLDVLQPHRAARQRHLLCGDFNSNAPYQRIDPAKCKEKTRAAWEQNGGKLPRNVIEKILASGYLDTYHVHHDEIVEMTGSFDTQHPAQRVDYIFAFGWQPSNVKSAWVEQDRLAKYASDHFPIGAEIE